MRVVVSDHASDVNLRLQCALSMFGAVFVDMARIHAAVVAVKGHRFLGLVVVVVVGDLDVRHGSIRCGSPVRFSHCNRCNNRRDNTDGFQMLFEINSIFFIFTVFWGSPFVKFCVLYGGNFARRCRRCPWTSYAVDNRPTHCLRTSYPIPKGEVVSVLVRWKALCLYMSRIKKLAMATNKQTNQQV